jgi:hypothetical protein
MKPSNDVVATTAALIHGLSLRAPALGARNPLFDGKKKKQIPRGLKPARDDNSYRVV